MKSPFHLHLSSIAVASTALLVACGTEPTTPTDAPSDTPLPLLAVADAQGTANHMIAMPEGQRPSEELLAAIEATGGTVLHTHDDIGVIMATGLSDDAVAELAARGDVEAIDEDVEVQWIPPVDEFNLEFIEGPTAEHDQSGAFFFDRFQWNMRQIQADAAWLVTAQGSGTEVCVLDTGVDPGHLDLVGKVDLAKSASFVPSEQFIEDLNFHGTFVSALITSNGIGMASVAPDAGIIAVKVLSQFGSGTFDALLDGLEHCAHNGGEVANMSLGALVLRSESRSLILALRRAIEDAEDHGVLVVAAAGNSAINFDIRPWLGVSAVPAMIGGVLSVGATAPINQANFDALASYTNFGERALDVMAPGGDLVAGGVIEDLILSACSRFVCGADGFYVLSAGTSFSAPLASGHAAVIDSDLPGDQGPRKLTNCIRFHGVDDLGAPGHDALYGSGRINVLKSALTKECGH